MSQTPLWRPLKLISVDRPAALLVPDPEVPCRWVCCSTRR